MFKRILFIFILLAFSVSPVLALDVSTHVSTSYPQDTSISDVLGLEIQAKYHNYYAFISQDIATKYLVGQTVGEYHILGFGLGGKVYPFRYFSISGQFGYYQPKMKFADEMGEAVYREMHRLSDPVDGWCVEGGTLCCDGYEIDYDQTTAEYRVHGNFGGDIRLNLDFPITQRWNVYGFIGYRVLEFSTHCAANIKNMPPRVEDGEQAFHIFSDKDSLSGGQAGIGVFYRW